MSGYSGNPNPTTTALGTAISGATSKTTPVDADSIALSDSAASNILKKLTWANLKATLKAYFDTLYAAVGSGITNFAGANVVMKSDGTNAVASRITDDGSLNLILDGGTGNAQLDGAFGTYGGFLSGNGNGFAFDDNAQTAAITGINGVTVNNIPLRPAITVYLASDYTNATATFSNTALSVALVTSKIYKFILNIYAANTQAAEGFKVDFNGGNGTAAYFRAGTATSLVTGVTTALSGTFSNGTLTGTNLITIDGYIECNGSGTFIVRGAENTHVAGAITFQQGSNLVLIPLN